MSSDRDATNRGQQTYNTSFDNSQHTPSVPSAGMAVCYFVCKLGWYQSHVFCSNGQVFSTMYLTKLICKRKCPNKLSFGFPKVELR